MAGAFTWPHCIMSNQHGWWICMTPLHYVLPTWLVHLQDHVHCIMFLPYNWNSLLDNNTGWVFYVSEHLASYFKLPLNIPPILYLYMQQFIVFKNLSGWDETAVLIGLTKLWPQFTKLWPQFIKLWPQFSKLWPQVVAWYSWTASTNVISWVPLVTACFALLNPGQAQSGGR